MLFLTLALLTLAALAALLHPFLRPAPTGPARSAYDLAVYRAQLAELEADRGRGLLPEAQRAGARLEIQRRMLEAAKAAAIAPADSRTARRMAAFVVAVLLPLTAGLLYAALGHPSLPDRPYTDRLEHDPAVILADAAQKMETALSAKPSRDGYRRLSELYLQMQDFPRAAAAITRAIALGADDAADWATLGQVTVLGAGGAVGPPARAAFARALLLAPYEPRARFYAGLAAAQDGHLTTAVAIWRDLERDSKADAPWLATLRAEIAAAGKAGHFDPAGIPPSKNLLLPDGVRQ